MKFKIFTLMVFGSLRGTVLGQVPPPISASSTPTKPGQVVSSRINHNEAYKTHPERGEHISLKITPPEKRGKDTMVLVEVYNKSKVRVSVMSFDITLKNHGAKDIFSHLQVEDLSKGWSVPRWVKIPGTGKIPTIDSVIIDNVKIVDALAAEVKMKVYSDLIKE